MTTRRELVQAVALRLTNRWARAGMPLDWSPDWDMIIEEILTDLARLGVRPSQRLVAGGDQAWRRFVNDCRRAM